MTFKDLLDLLDMTQRVVINYYPKGGNNHVTKIMNVRRIPWEKLRRWLGCKVWKVKPCVDNEGKPYLFIGIE